MIARLSGHIRHNVVAYVALFFALTAPASALVITGELVQDESLTGADVRNDTLTGADILESSLAPVPAALIAGNAQNAVNAQNADKLDNLDSTAFVRDLSRHQGGSATDSDSGKFAVASCPAGKAAISGGGHTVVSQQSSLPSPNQLTFVAIDNIQVSPPSQVPGQVIVSATEIADTGHLDETWTVFAHAICAKIN